MDHDAVSHIVTHKLTDDLLLLGLAEHLDLSQLSLFDPVGLTRIIECCILHGRFLSHCHLADPVDSKLLPQIWVISSSHKLLLI